MRRSRSKIQGEFPAGILLPGVPVQLPDEHLSGKDGKIKTHVIELIKNNRMIDKLQENQYFVFGSNLAGRHGAGAAKFAHDNFGAEYGVGEGITGQCYAFPTLDENLRKRTNEELEKSRDSLFGCAGENNDRIFLLTAVGCGLAGYAISEIAPLFKNAPENIVLPEEFLTFNGQQK